MPGDGFLATQWEMCEKIDRVSAAVGLFLVFAAAASGADELLIENGFLVNPRTETVERGSLLIVDGVIAAATSEVPASFSGRRLDATGKWVLPALRDMHSHSYGNAGLAGQVEFLGTPIVAKRMLYAGVAGFLDLFSPEDSILGLRDRQRGEGLPGAEIFASGALLEDPMLIRLLAPNVLESYASSPESGSAHASGGASIDWEARRRERQGSLERMLAAGVPIVAGTDSGNVATVQGYSLHRELELMVENGVPTWQALRSATVEAGRLLGRDWGLDVGSEGSVLLLDSSPIEDISATQRINAVIHRGQQIDREALLDR